MLRNQARGMAAYMQIEQSDDQTRSGNEIREYVDSIPFDHVLAVVNPGGRILFSSDFLREL